MTTTAQALAFLKATSASLSDAATERFGRETLEGHGLHTLRLCAHAIEAAGGTPSMAFDWPSYFKPLKATNVTRADVIAYVAEAIEGAQWYVADDLRGLIDEIMVGDDLLMTLITWLPDAEWWKAFDLISERQPHHSSYLPQADASELMPPEATQKAVEDIKLGEYVKRKADATKVYRRGGFDRATKRFALVDCDDINREIWVKRGTILFIGFTY